MDPEADAYPEQSGRRRFVKGVVGSAALAGAAATGAVGIDLATNPTGAGGGITQYFGNVVLDGPAPRGMPQIPLEVNEDGDVRGVWPEPQEVEQQGATVTVAEMELGGITYSSEWFQYCGMQDVSGVEPEADQDNYLRYAESPPYQWQQEEVSPGDRVNVSDFEDYESWENGIGQGGIGKPAIATWRSQDVDSEDVIPVQVIRSPRVERLSAENEWIEASTAENFVANMNKCTHFCCVPGFKVTEQSASFDAENEIYCPCHQSVYAPFTIEQQTFVAFPRPDN